MTTTEPEALPAPFDPNLPLPPLKQHPRERLWEPAAVRYRDLPGGDAA